jgi:hypothetical protein
MTGKTAARIKLNTQGGHRPPCFFQRRRKPWPICYQRETPLRASTPTFMIHRNILPRRNIGAGCSAFQKKSTERSLLTAGCNQTIRTETGKSKNRITPRAFIETSAASANI